MTETRCAMYNRYSSHEQDGSSTIESQQRECRRYAREHGLTIAEDAIYVDRALEATTTEIRDAFKTMIAAAQRTPRPFDVIVTWKFARLFRNREEAVIYKGLLRRRGIEVISVSEPIDRESASGVLTEGMLEVLDQFFSARLGEEVRRGQTETTLDGFSTGGRPPYGCRRVEVQDPRGRVDRTGQPVIRVTLELEPAEAAIVLRIFTMYANAGGYKKIVLALNREGIPGPRGGSWDTSTVREILKNPIYRGARVYGRNQKIRTEKGTRSKRAKPPESWTTKENAHPAIIPPDLWERVQRKLQRTAEAYKRSGQKMARLQGLQSRHLLTGILRCAICGAPFIARPAQNRKTGQRYGYYGCSYHTRRGNDVCGNRSYLPLAAIEQDLLAVLQQAVLTPDTTARLLSMVNARLRAQATDARPRLQELKAGLARVDREIANFTRAIGRGDFASLDGALKAAEARRTTLLTELAALQQTHGPGVLQFDARSPGTASPGAHRRATERGRGEGAGGDRADCRKDRGGCRRDDDDRGKAGRAVGGRRPIRPIGGPGERHQRCAHGSDWAEVLAWKEELLLYLY
jgi:DNA invertase Pin-like site-specific DNA recombinase